jgi:hypothetical protein
MNERNYLNLTTQRISRLASLLAEVYHSASELDEFGSPGFRKRGQALRITALLFADCLPASIAVALADEVREWESEIDGDDTRAVALRSLLRRLDPGGSPKVLK